MARRLFRRRHHEQPDVVHLPEPLAAEVRVLLENGDRVEAVKLTRRRTGMNLLPTVRAVDALDRGNSSNRDGSHRC